MTLENLVQTIFGSELPKEKDFGVHYYNNYITIHMTRPFNDAYNHVTIEIEIGRRNISISLGYEHIKSGEPVRLIPNEPVNLENGFTEEDECFEWMELETDNERFNINDFQEILREFPLQLTNEEIQENHGFWCLNQITNYTNDDVKNILEWTRRKAINYGFLIV